LIKRFLDRSVFFTLITLFILMCASLVFLYPDGRSFFILNGLHNGLLDYSLTYLTHIGDGITVIILCVLLLIFYNFGSGLISIIGLGVIGLVSHLMKYYLFANSPRPHLYFWGNKMIHYVEGVKINIENSFPSGHTFTAFYIFTFIAMLAFSKPIFRQILLAFLAIVSAYSRVYLAQHFVGDILTGAVMGIIFGLLFYKIYTKSKNYKSFNSNLIQLIRK